MIEEFLFKIDFLLQQFAYIAIGFNSKQSVILVIMTKELNKLPCLLVHGQVGKFDNLHAIMFYKQKKKRGIHVKMLF
jgi:hypothetical protein